MVEKNPPLMAVAAVLSGMTAPEIVAQVDRDLQKRRVVLSEMRIAPLDFPDGEEWMCVPEYTDRKIDLSTWKHRSGAEFVERVSHPWMREPTVRYEVCSPWFSKAVRPPGCRAVHQYYPPDGWYAYTFAEEQFDAACAYCLAVYARMAAEEYGDRGAHGQDEIPEQGWWYETV